MADPDLPDVEDNLKGRGANLLLGHISWKLQKVKENGSSGGVYCLPSNLPMQENFRFCSVWMDARVTMLSRNFFKKKIFASVFPFEIRDVLQKSLVIGDRASV